MMYASTSLTVSVVRTPINMYLYQFLSFVNKATSYVQACWLFIITPLQHERMSELNAPDKKG